MAETILYGIAEDVLKNLGSRALNEIAATWDFKDRLEKLKTRVSTIKDVLLDAEERQTDSHAVRNWSTAVYVADDLFDEFNTIASRNQLMGGSKFTKEVKAFLSPSNQILFASKISSKIKAIRKKLDVIFEDSVPFNLAVRALEQGSVITRKSDQAHSYVDAAEVIGRDDDKHVILELLLAENEHEQEVLAVLPIVGIGGMGKTTLAQLIYNDPQVPIYFELKLWVCVAEDFDIKLITEKILRSATNTETPKLDMDQLHYKLRGGEIGGKKYLLVLDDVWEEDPDKWGELKPLLKIGRNGSKILVTTRSMKVAEIMGTFPRHELQVLSKEKSWDLFEKMAFKSGEDQHKPHLVNLGRELVKKCANVPLAIVSLGRLLRCEHESKWLSFKDKNLANVMSILKLSYQHLSSPLKNCFAYCALFPKDYVFKKEMLIELWMAEGFLIPGFNNSQSLEDVAEDYFLDLLQRGFFQDVRRNEWGDIESCKMHDLIHDLAQQVAEFKCKCAKFGQTDFKDTILHLSFTNPLPPSWEIPNEMMNSKLIRTIHYFKEFYSRSSSRKSTCQQVVTRFCHLRVLDFQDLELKSLPSPIGKLIQLRYLNLSGSNLETLPKSITNLYNLQTLNLQYCMKFKTLPNNIQKLVNLRSLDVSGCVNLTHMPSGIGGLTLLHKLPMFIATHNKSVAIQKKPTSAAKLSDLKKLNNLKGHLSICLHNSSEYNKLEAIEADITNKHGLTELNLVFVSETTTETNKKGHLEAVLEGLKPHCNLKYLRIEGYMGEKLPRWAVMENLGNTLPNLVKITLHNFTNCEQVPSFCQLGFLKHLELYRMDCVVYMAKSQAPENIFFPSLEELRLHDMKNLKGWWEVVEATTSNDEANGIARESRKHLLSLQFLKLSKLIIRGCPNMISMPVCPNLEILELCETNKKLLVFKMDPISLPTTSTLTSSLPSFSSGRSSLMLKRLVVDDAQDLILFSQLGLGRLSILQLEDKKLESTEILREVFITLSSPLRDLEFWECKSLRSIAKGLEHLTALDNLSFWDCEELKVSKEEDADLMPWKALTSSLRYLRLGYLPKVASLPSGIQHLTNLRSLILIRLEEFRELPEWISCLSSLENLVLDSCPRLTYLPQGIKNLTSLSILDIWNCSGLAERCQRPNGIDWPKIQHIPVVRGSYLNL